MICKNTGILFILLELLYGDLNAQETIHFLAPDNLEITGDLYEADNSPSYVLILSHQANASRGEYIEVGKTLMALGYTSLAIDLRSGAAFNTTENETHKNAIQKGFPKERIYAEQDILASINFVKNKYPKAKIILLGSSYSASLSLMIGAFSEDVDAIIAYSPGEYIQGLSVSTYIQYIKKPVFATGKKDELNDIKTMIGQMEDRFSTIFSPVGNSVHGASNLHQKTDDYEEHWDALKAFLKKLP